MKKMIDKEGRRERRRTTITLDGYLEKLRENSD
jgi:hypothetical protein